MDPEDFPVYVDPSLRGLDLESVPEFCWYGQIHVTFDIPDQDGG